MFCCAQWPASTFYPATGELAWHRIARVLRFTVHAWGVQGYIFINTTCATFQQDSSLRFSQTERNYGCNPSDYSSNGYHVSRVQLLAGLMLDTQALSELLSTWFLQGCLRLGVGE